MFDRTCAHLSSPFQKPRFIDVVSAASEMAQNSEAIANLRALMLDFDNYEGCDPKYSYIFNDLNVSSGKCVEYWETLIAHNFHQRNLCAYFEGLDEEQRWNFFYFGIACASRFVQANYTGPPIDESTKQFLTSKTIACVEYVKLLSINNEDIHPFTEHPCLLVAALYIFTGCLVNPVVNLWWQWRAIMLHQSILDELSPALLSTAENLQKDIRELNLTGYLRGLFEIEQALLYCDFRCVTKADDHIKLAGKYLGLEYELSGKLGKRTKHQQVNIAQLTLEVSLLDLDGVERPSTKTLKVPANVSLDDENIRLDTIKYVSQNNIVNLPNTEQKLMLLLANHMIVFKPRDDLFYEELKPFIDLILSQNNTWAVRFSTLLLRCSLEAKNKHTIERSMTQCEELVKAIRAEEPSVINRVGGVYSTDLIPIWKTEEGCADLMLDLGLVKAALDIYLKWHAWEEVIVCYTILKIRHKAAAVITQQLQIKPTVKLYCLLGDVLDDPILYETAWEMSKRRSHRAQRHWGQYYFERKQYKECIPHFEKSVSINPLQDVVWLRLGFAALETENWQIAATAYRRYTTLEPDGFEAWNNLAQAYIKLGNKRNAHQALQDALRCNFDNWKVWENFLFVSADISNYSDVLRAYHKLLDLKEKYLNTDVLKVLVYGVCNEADDNESKSPNSLLRQTRLLLGRVTALYPAEGSVWELYALVAPMMILRIQRLQRAYRGYTQGSWSNDVNCCKHVLYICLKLGEAVLDDEIAAEDILINSVRLNISSAISVIKKLDYEDTKALLLEVTSLLAKIIEKSKSAAPPT